MKKYSSDNIFLNSVNDLTRQAYSQDVRNKPLNNSPTITRLESDLFITKKEEFESNNSKINNLHDEIRGLKSKLKIIEEKDSMISELKMENEKNEEEIIRLNNIIIELKDSKTDNIRLKNENDQYRFDLMNMRSIQQKNRLLSEKLIELTKKTENKEKEEIIGKDENRIKIDIDKIKIILNNRLKTYQEDHIQKIIDEYELSNKEYISKDILTELLSKAIHI